MLRRTVFTLLASAVVLVPTSLLAAAGGPDGLGWYTWADSDEPSVSATPPSYSGTDIRSLGYTGSEAVIELVLPTAVFPTGFEFYNIRYDRLWLSTNGWLSFENPAGNPHDIPAAIPGLTAPDALVAWFWDDLTVDTAAAVANAGPNTAGDGYTIFVRFQPDSGGSLVQMYITLYLTGEIQLSYRGNPDQNTSAQTAIGIENQTGQYGLAYMTGGVASNGANLRSDYAVRFYPQGSLDCQTGVTALSCPMPATAFDNVGGVNNVSAYSCTPGIFDGNERVFDLNLTNASDVRITLTNTDGGNRSAFLMRAGCSEFSSCLVGGVTLIDRQFLAPGQYYIVVDGATALDNGSFTLAIECSAAGVAASCGSSFTGESVGGASVLTGFSCATGDDGPETVYAVDVTGPATLRAHLTNKSNPNLKVMISDAASFNPQFPDCVTSDPNTATLWGAQTGTYYVTVDSPAGTNATYDLEIECSSNLACAAPGSRVIDINDRTPIAGDTTGQANNVETYFCANSNFGPAGETTGLTGPEDVYEFTVTTPTVVAFIFDTDHPDMRLLLLDACYEGACVMEGGCAETLAPGTYRLVVDGLNGAEGRYAVTPFLIPTDTYQPWTACSEECSGNCGQDEDDIRLRQFQFDSGNFCGTGCDFSLFVAVECGTSFHIPFWDVETGHMQIYDVFQERYVDLLATNDLPANRFPPAERYTSAGTTVLWEDEGCNSIPCPGGGIGCGGGSDPRTTDVVMDVSFEGSPNVCGVYRLDFSDWGGWRWEIFANCTAERQEQFYLYRDLCSAIADYRPRPEGGLSDVTIDNAQCDSQIASGTFTVENVGCLPTSNYEVIINTVPPTTPKVYTVDLLQGEQQVIPWTYDIPSAQTNLTFEVDPTDSIRECSENLGTTVSCGLNTPLVRVWEDLACPDVCGTAAAAAPVDKLCEGQDAMLDGSPSSFTCVTGSPQYRWEDDTGAAICDWSPSPTCNAPALSLNAGPNLLTLKTRCDGDVPACETTSLSLVEVIPNLQPTALGNDLRAIRDEDTVRFSWAAVIADEISGYRVYKAGERELRAPGRGLVADVLSDRTTAQDEGAVSLPPATAYYQVIGVSCLGDIEGPY